jgi:HK97 family phage portal protein
VGIFTGRRAAEQRNIGDIGNPLIPQRPDSRTTAGIIVTPDSALTLSALWRCVTLRADMASTLPIDAYRSVGDVDIKITKPGLLRSPGGATMSPEEWFYATQVSLDLRGNAYGIYATVDGFGYPTAIELLHPDQVLVKRDKDGHRVYLVNGKQVDATRMYHERQFTFPGNLTGLSPVSYHARTLGIGLAAEKFGADWFNDGAHPSSVLMTDRSVDDSQAKTIKAKFVEAVRGTREPLILGLGVKYQAIQVAPNESQFLETMRYGAVQVARIFGVRPERIGESGGSSMTYANVEQAGIDDLTYGFGPMFARREAAFSRMLPSQQFVRYNLKALLRADAETRFKTHAIGIAGKFWTPDEARAEEGEPPLTKAQKDELGLIPLTVTPMGMPKALPNPPATPTSGEDTPA